MDRKQGGEERPLETVKLGNLLAQGNGIAKEGYSRNDESGKEKSECDVGGRLTMRMERPRVWFRIM